MKYLSLFSGIEAATVAWHKLGWEPVGFSEIEPFPCAVLQHHYPNITNYGDITNHAEWKLPKDIDLIVGGSPCQSFSVAGLRKGLADPRGNLMLTYLAVVERVRPRWVVWENVPGVLSSDGGRALGTFLGALGELGYGWAYRVLDAQWVRTHRHPRAVPQRRRRVFVVGCLGDWKRAAQVLFERESVQRDSASSRASRKAAPSDAEARIACCVTTGEGKRQDYETCTIIPQPVPYDLFQITAPVNRQNRKPGDPCHTLARDNAAHAAVAFNWQNGGGYGNANEGLGITVEGTGPIQRCNTPAVAYVFRDPCPTLTAKMQGSSGWAPANEDAHLVGQSINGEKTMTVRRLTPRECERLQGFPDDYTAIPWRGKAADQCPDGPRYKALGNSMAVNCMAWIGERIGERHA